MGTTFIYGSPIYGSQPTKYTISLVASGIIMSSDDLKRFERVILFALPKFNGVISEDAYEFLVDFPENKYNFDLLSLMEFLKLLS